MLRPSMSTPDIRVSALKGMYSTFRLANSRPRRPYNSLASTTIERPSGVSSGSDESCAASASSSLVTPAAVRNSDACRLPSVMVPVLSSSSVFTSPAASTARPLTASTLCCTRRSMPAMPMADSSPPMVVGIRHTSSEISTNAVCGAPEYTANGSSVATARRKIIVSPASSIFSAISLGVFCRDAPSTSAIMRSRNVSPGLAVMRTTITSLSTRVPPVTAERSPPASRITGADSPVMADSSTDATPSITSPSPGIICPATTRTLSPTRKCELAISSTSPFAFSLYAVVSDLARRSASACALPRPSAMAVAKLANSTVNHSHSVICRLKPKCPWCGTNSSTVVTTEPTSTTNITGFFAISTGLSFFSESMLARRTIAPSNKFFFFAVPVCAAVIVAP